MVIHSSPALRTVPREYVGSGQYRISCLVEEKMFAAILGTCVAVALYDREAAIGGMAHFLLPAPNDPAAVFQPMNYADPGLGLFIEELLRAGARKERLEAAIAGGALFGPVSRQDILLDLGGRTVEVVMRILAANQIWIAKAETGGLNGSILLLDLTTLEPFIQPLPHQEQSPRRNIARPSPLEIEETINHTNPIPQIALKIIRMVRQQDHDLKELAAEVRHDQVICAKVLQFCNSALLGLRTRIDSIDQALAFLGENHLLEIIVAAAIEPLFFQTVGGYSLMRGGLYKHSLGVAHAARGIASFTGRADHGTAYTAGLLHDIGKIVLDHYLVGFFPYFYQRDPTDSSDFIELERELLGIDHLKAGRRLGEKWQLPESLIEVISFHHWPENAVADLDLSHIVYLADMLTTWFMAGLEQEKINTESLVRRLAHLGLESAQLPRIIELVPWNSLMYL